MQLTPAEDGKFKAVVHHFEKLRDTFEMLSVILAEDDPRLNNLYKLKQHLDYFKDRFEREEAEKAAKKRQEAHDLEVGTTRVMLALQTFYPKAFPIEAEKVKPLYIGIDHQIHAALTTVNKIEGLEVTYAMIGEALRRWVTTEAYYLSFKSNGHRVDIYGNPVEYILQRDFNHANKKYVQMTRGQQTAARKTIDDLPVATPECEAELAREILNAILRPSL
ncbi:putative RNA chaperone [Rhizobium phage RL2RES]|uniref:Putative RNA chaperone n=1 Tax=Rhizobium phage RL2RES TaxID=103371 RepID=A0A6B9J3F7_9CAUD|nr:putative RNA chaperone [Rhizobium phage RL2RES]QGZ14162.1 putative RNA chaperone [Rhizobium phage RL2RES]